MITLKTLNYEYSDLEPNIDAKTLEIHHSKHHAGYVANLNKFIKGTELENDNVQNILRKISSLTVDNKQGIKNNAGGVLMHNTYFNQFSKNPASASNELGDKINEDFGSFDEMIEIFKNKALTQFGSGWSVLVLNTKTKNLDIIAIANQDAVEMLTNGILPLATLDVWEHAYYLQYQNKRADYLNNVVKSIDWDNVQKHYLNHI